MKHLIFFFLLFSALSASAQFGSLGEKIKQKVKESVERQTDKTIDKVIGKGENKVDKKVDDVIDGTPSEKKKKTKRQESESPAEGSGSESKGSESRVENSSVFSVNSKYDFISGAKVTGVEDFSQDEIGDFPAKWNTNSSGEIVNLQSSEKSKWLKFASKGVYFPDFINELPENFTLEFDMVATGDLSEMEGGLGVVFLDKSERKLSFDVFNMTTQVGLDIHPFAENGESKIWVVNQNSEELMRNNIKIDWNTNRVNRISFWRQKTRLRMYINQTKVWDIPRAFMPGINYSFLFNTNLWSGSLLLSNLKLAIGLPDTRNKLVTEGKFVTHGILFDVNSDVIKPESAGVLKEIATVLQENPGIKINVIGHTDSDGNTAANMLLSKRRADAVRNTLAKNYGIASDRMQAEGKGASVPIDSNQSIQGKTNNRRVEFVKIN